MPVDRVSRDAAARALASFLRGETSCTALEASLRRVAAARATAAGSESGQDLELDSWLQYWLRFERHGRYTEKQWRALCRNLAFLHTALEQREFQALDNLDKGRPRQVLLARRHTLGLTVALVAGYCVSWWVVAAATLLSFILYQASMRRRVATAAAGEAGQTKPQAEYYPFVDEDEWSSYKHHLDQHQLPKFDPKAFRDPAAPSIWIACLIAPVQAVGLLLLVAMILYMYAFSIVMWPLWLVFMSLSKRDPGPEHRVAS
jgi:hypothetical protein